MRNSKLIKACRAATQATAFQEMAGQQRAGVELPWMDAGALLRQLDREGVTTTGALWALIEEREKLGTRSLFSTIAPGRAGPARLRPSDRPSQPSCNGVKPGNRRTKLTLLS
jgi:hypothetical protein